MRRINLRKWDEPKCRTEAVRNLWIWYRIYGYNYGLIHKPVQCPDEYISSRRQQRNCRPRLGSKLPDRSTYDYERIEPKQQEAMRNFLAGVGITISGIFCVTISSRIGGNFGYPLIGWGMSLMWDAINPLITYKQERELRQKELLQIQAKAEQAAKTTN